MIYSYKIINKDNQTITGTIEAINQDSAIQLLQGKGFSIIEIQEGPRRNWLERLSDKMALSVSRKDVLILSQQIAILFKSQVSALRVFKLLSAEAEKPGLRSILIQIADKIQAGSSLSQALQGFPRVFSPFYVAMVRAGEESGKVAEMFTYMSEYLDRNYDVSSKVERALFYPAFVVVTFIAALGLMMAVIIPKIRLIIEASSQEIPFYTKLIFNVSDFLAAYGLLIIGLLAAGLIFLWRYSLTDQGKIAFDKFKLSLPLLGDLYRKLFLARIADNLSTMISSGISMVKSLEISADVVDNQIYKLALLEAVEEVRGGTALSDALSQHEMFSTIFVQMVKVGEETGSLDSILNTMASFYKREVTNAIDTMIDLIEPAMILFLGLAVGTLLAAVLMPIYNISASFNG